MQLLGVRVYTIKVARSIASASDEEECPELVLALINCCGIYQYTVPNFPANELVATCS